MRIEQLDDRFELLMSLSSRLPISASGFMLEFTWCGQRFREAMKGIRKMRIALEITDQGDGVRIRSRCSARARTAADAYVERIYGGNQAA